MTNQLKPCPFCDGAARVSEAYAHYIVCAGCNAFGPNGDDDLEAAHKWNTRPQDAEVERLRARVAELEAALAIECETPAYRSDGFTVDFAGDNLAVYVTTSTGATTPPLKRPEES